jgi:hypothetical protein
MEALANSDCWIILRSASRGAILRAEQLKFIEAHRKELAKLCDVFLANTPRKARKIEWLRGSCRGMPYYKDLPTVL